MRIFSLLLATIVLVAKAQDKPPCNEAWTCFNGNMAGPVNDTASCEAACRSCEGGDFRCQDLKMSTVEAMVGNETTSTTVYQCQCFKVDTATSSCTSSDRRDICTDPGFDPKESEKVPNSSATASISSLAVIVTGVAAFVATI